MKTIQFFIAFFLAVSALHAQDYNLYWKYKDYDGSIAVSVPRLGTWIGSSFVQEKEDRALVRKVHKVRVLYFEDESPFTQRDLKRFVKKSKRKGLEELITVRHGKTHVRILAKSKGATIRKIVVLFSAPDGAGLVTVKGKFQLDEINKVIEKSSKKGQHKDGVPTIPNLPSVPVIRA